MKLRKEDWERIAHKISWSWYLFWRGVRKGFWKTLEVLVWVLLVVCAIGTLWGIDVCARHSKVNELCRKANGAYDFCKPVITYVEKD